MSNTTGENFSIQGYNLVTLLKRLEAATSRLEDVTIFQEQRVQNPVSVTTNNDNSKAIDGAAKLEAIAAPIESVTIAAKPKSVEAFDELIANHVTPLATLSKELDNVLTHQMELLLSAFEKERDIIELALESKSLPLEDPVFQEVIIKPVNSIIMKIIEIKDGNRTYTHYNALNSLAEGVPVLGWICAKTPVSYVPEFKDSAQFWTNRVLKDFKQAASEGDDKAKKWVEWMKLYLSLFDELKAYVKEWASTGLVFKGTKELEDVVREKADGHSSAEAPAAPSPSGGAAPPPPPPPPPPPADLFDNLDKSNSEPAGMGAVFADLNKGEGITSGLKKVDKSQMTHKNPDLRKKSGPLPPQKPKSLKLSTSPAPATPTVSEKPPKKELLDNKWMIMNQKDAGLMEIEVTMDQSVFIGNCIGTVIQLKGKVNAVSINNCQKVGVVVDRTVSSLDLNKCKSCEVQVMDYVPVMSIDQSESISLYLTGEEAQNVEIYSSSTTALNVNIPKGDDVQETPVAEQFKTTLVDGKLVTVAVSGE